MGQYYHVYNLDKEEFLHPHKFNDGLKFMEFAEGGDGVMFALSILTSSGNGKGGGDFPVDDPLVGSWAGDRITIAGDYDDDEKFLPEDWREHLTLEMFANRNGEGEEPDEGDIESWRNGRINLCWYADIVGWEDISDDVVELIKKCGEKIGKEYRSTVIPSWRRR